MLEKVYGSMVTTPATGYDFAIGFDLDAVKPEDKDALLKKVACLRRNVLAAPIVKALEGVKANNGGSLPFMALEMRNKECMFIKPGNDRCTIVFALNFPEETDNVSKSRKCLSTLLSLSILFQNPLS
jgi:actin related protein 2/3 complex, subunit 2